MALDAFPAIRDYALIGDCRSAALVAADGSIEWLCLPDFQSPSLFGRILDRDRGGFMKVAPPDVHGRHRRYIEGTNILETVFETPRGTARLTDLLPVHTSGDASLQPEREVLRVIEALEGEPEIDVDVCPAPHYGEHRPHLRNRGRIGWSIDHSSAAFILRSDIELRPTGEARLHGCAHLSAGERRHVSLSYVGRDPAVLPPLGAAADAKLERSRAWWQDWSGQCTYDGPYKEAVLRSVLALKALQFSPSGAVVAAVTTSLPEAIGAERNWDYRYCWLRDAAFTLRAFIDTGFDSEAGMFFEWLMHATRLTQPKLQALYDVYGRSQVPERTLDHLSGYRDSRPVRVGNAAHDQLQLDVYGSVAGAAAVYLHHGHPFDRSERRLLGRLGKTVCKAWRQPDNGIWEYRDGRRHNTWSKVMCWWCLDNLIRLDEAGILSVPHERFCRERAAIREAIETEAFDAKSGSFVGAFGERFMDATLLLLPRTGFVDACDPRMRSTWERIERELNEGDLIRRYGHAADRLSGREGAFVICGFWAVDYLARARRLDEAHERMRHLLGYANDLGLLSEEINPSDRTMLGNFPQAFSHSGLIDAALAIAEAEAGEEPA